MQSDFEAVTSRDPHEKEFHQAVSKVLQSVAPVLERNPECRTTKIIQRIVEPESVIMSWVPWIDEQDNVYDNRCF